MKQVDAYQKDVVTVPAHEPIAEVADRMLREEVGCVVVLSERDRPVGIVTDRDLTLRAIGDGALPEDPVSSIMSKPLVEVSPSDPIDAVVEVMGNHSIRRVPVVRDKQLVGLLSLDDVLVGLARELHDVAEASKREVRSARRAARARQVRHELEDGLVELIGHVERIGDSALESVVGELDSVRDRIRRLFE